MTPLTDNQKLVYDFVVSHSPSTCGSVSLHLWCSMVQARQVLSELVDLGLVYRQNMGNINHYYAVIKENIDGRETTATD